MGMIGNSLAQGLISGANIQDGTVDTPDIKDSAVTAAKIASAVVTPAKMDFSAGTANGVLYLNGSKVASSGSALVFDGTNLGIGAADPAYQLDIGNGTTVTNRIRFRRGSDDPNQYMTLGWNSISVYRATTALSSPQTSLSFNQIGSDGTRTPLFISSAGYIGVNQTSPGYRFQITGGSDIASSSMQLTVNANVANQISLSNGYANRSGIVFLGDGSSGNTSFGVISTQQALLFSTAAYNVSGVSDLSTGWTERARFSTTGNFMVGGNSGESKLNVFSGGSNAFTSGTLPPGMTIYGAAGDGYGSMLSFKPEPGSQGISGIASFRTSGYQTDLRFYTNSTSSSNAFTERARFDSSGNFTMVSTGGYIYGKSALAYAAITDLGWKSAFQVQEIDTGTTANRFIPMISGTSVSSSGYRQHTVFGSYRGSTWGSAFIGVGGNDSYPTRGFYFSESGNFSADGTKNFSIDHPLPEKAETHKLVHAAVEAPQADLIYRGRVALVGGLAEVNIDVAARMTDGTLVAFTKNVQCFTTNESDWKHVRGSVSGNVLTIESEDSSATSIISWMVVAERDDPATYLSSTDGRLVVEPAKEPTPDPDPGYELSPAPTNEEQE